MINQLARKATSPVRLAALLAATVLLVLLSPSEQTLGGLVKVIYVHGAMVRVAEVAFLAAGALGVLYLVKENGFAFRWSAALQKTAFMYWLISFLVSLYAMQVVWGGIDPAEPRFISTGRILAIAAVAIAVTYIWDNPKAVAASSIILAAVVIFQTATAGFVLHPTDAIGGSPSLITKAAYYAIVVLFAALAMETARLLLPGGRRPGAV